MKSKDQKRYEAVVRSTRKWGGKTFPVTVSSSMINTILAIKNPQYHAMACESANNHAASMDMPPYYPFHNFR